MNPAEESPAGPPMLPPALSSIGSEERNLAMLCHLLGIFTGFLGPLILWLVKKDSSPFIAHHGRESLNFQITLLLVMLGLGIVTMALMLVLVGILMIPLLVVVPILALVLEILAAVAASEGRWHRYPVCLRLV